jgi:hypothetical protein
MNSKPHEVVVPLRDNPGKSTPSPIDSSWSSRYETYSGIGSASMSAPNAASSSSSDGCGGIYMIAEPGHVRVRESSRGVSGIGGNLVMIDMASMGEEGSETGGIESTSVECSCSGDEGGWAGASDMIDFSESESAS